MNEDQQARQGVIFAISAYLMWGIAPIYFKTIQHVPPTEILCHRVIWSFVFLGILIHAGKQWLNVRFIFNNRKQLLFLTATSFLVGSNWLLFIWSVNNDHMLDASLGYFINPLFNVLLGMVFLGERLRKFQWLAVALATTGVMIQIIIFGSIPVIAFVLATTFGIYGLLRKKVAVDSQTGLFIETLILLPIAFIYLFFFADTSTSHLSNNSWSLNGLLFLAGIVTTLPLLAFNNAATRLKLSTLGFFQYIGPSLMFLLAILIYGEDFRTDKAITFSFIWCALLIFSFEGLNNRRKQRRKQ
ncbi:EamA-like transporter family protein [Vibrio aerogenes CECT 7868]|uniref:EamA-like transporter family protein n=1 Tax=Vibrio aerogenes CECT 7868 TaxID=1216006 RepID=A0A1M6AMG5_9VIBR|nr:EamA family transporter RarD [Vibrio aerogenes]SHI37597.1 EamA-like transporter family protein [Vibrio aerogenes CECT 7868]